MYYVYYVFFNYGNGFDQQKIYYARLWTMSVFVLVPLFFVVVIIVFAVTVTYFGRLSTGGSHRANLLMLLYVCIVNISAKPNKFGLSVSIKPNKCEQSFRYLFLLARWIARWVIRYTYEYIWNFLCVMYSFRWLTVLDGTNFNS